MSNFVKNLLIFTGGAGVGAAGMYLFLKHREKKVYETNDVDAFYVDSLDTEHMEQIVEKHENLNKPDISLYASELKEHGYIDYSKFSEKEKKEEKGKSDETEDVVEKIEEIRVITEEYFDKLSDEDYRFIGYSYFNDGVLADENNEKVEQDEMETSVGVDWELYFKNPECDAVYVVNERLHVAYEILRDLRLYKNVAEARGE